MFKVLKNGTAPTKGSKYSAAVDLYASEDVVIGAGETAIVGLGVCIDLENSNIYKTSDYKWANKKDASEEVIEVIKQQAIRDFMAENYLELHPRSSLRAKGLISNTGIIDLDYTDEIKIIIHNPIQTSTYRPEHIRNDNEFIIKKNDKIAQILLKEHKSYLFGIESEEERTGGFGSTDE